MWVSGSWPAPVDLAKMAIESYFVKIKTGPTVIYVLATFAESDGG
jgi:hypothetical protein